MFQIRHYSSSILNMKNTDITQDLNNEDSCLMNNTMSRKLKSFSHIKHHILQDLNNEDNCLMNNSVSETEEL